MVAYFDFIPGQLSCVFRTGLGMGQQSFVGDLKGYACAKACMERKKTDDSIDGVSYSNSPTDNSCYCNMNMGRIATENSDYSTCRLVKTG